MKSKNNITAYDFLKFSKTHKKIDMDKELKQIQKEIIFFITKYKGNNEYKIKKMEEINNKFKEYCEKKKIQEKEVLNLWTKLFSEPKEFFKYNIKLMRIIDPLTYKMLKENDLLTFKKYWKQKLEVAKDEKKKMLGL